jgi:hypothetical protein
VSKKSISRKSLMSGFAAYRARIAAGEIEQVQMRELRSGDVTTAEQGGPPRVVAGVVPVETGIHKRADVRVSFTDGTEVTLYSEKYTTRRGPNAESGQS